MPNLKHKVCTHDQCQCSPIFTHCSKTFLNALKYLYNNTIILLYIDVCNILYILTNFKSPFKRNEPRILVIGPKEWMVSFNTIRWKHICVKYLHS